MRIKILDHPLVAHKISVLRDKNTPSPTFRQLVDELVTLLAYEATREIRVEQRPIETPVARTMGTVIANPKPLVVPILRAGLGMLEGMTRLVPTAEVGFLGMARNEETLDIVTYAERGAESITCVCLIAAPEGIAALEKGVEGLRNIDLFLAAKDERLNEKAYIVPGLGDAGDRLYGLAQ